LSANGDGNAGFGTGIGSGYRVSSFDAVRAQNSFRYDTPSMNGFSASYLLSEKNDIQVNTGTTVQSGNLVNQSQGRDKVSEYGLAYLKGPLSVRYAALTTEQWGGTLTSYTTGNAYAPTTWTLGAGAQFKLNTLSAKYEINPAVTVAYFNQIAKSDALIVANATVSGTSSTTYDRKTNGFAATYTTGVTKLMFNYASVANGDSATSVGVAKNGLSTKVLGLGVDYGLSKRTFLYGRYEKDTDGIGARSIATGYTAKTGNTTYTATAVGIRHTF